MGSRGVLRGSLLSLDTGKPCLVQIPFAAAKLLNLASAEMGAVCGKQNSASEPKARRATVEVSGSSPAAGAPQQPPAAAPAAGADAGGAAAAAAAEPAAAAAAADKAKEFITGEGDGVYLMLLNENNSQALVQQYAHKKPTVQEGELLLLQIKPPIYVEIKESRFTLQNGKRTLKVGIPMAMKNADGQKKVCEAALECLRLTCSYSAYIHAFPDLVRAPFSILLLVLERHEPGSIKEGPDGGKIVSSLAEEASQTNAGTEPTAEEAQKGEGQAAEAAAGAAAGKPEGSGDAAAAAAPAAAAAAAANDSNNQSIFPEGPQEVAEPAAAPKATEQVQVLRHLAEGRSANFSSMRQIIILPLENSKAKEVLKEGSVVEDEQMEQLQKQVEKLHGVMIKATPEKPA
ncbi:hypothetical protein, conserved [Eimeria necatrix]|uniref:Immune mapped protein 2 N-terminal domain-containing protein n=1 Tax=Eimeria necatrix TaxID=51315 RepID=U6MVN3_9EIME|nr:hypothetical protein, conserved [Eimeria necatrix]CDJ67053.1 hypothetical protein, conserved [Eimeria necatrix]